MMPPAQCCRSLVVILLRSTILGAVVRGQYKEPNSFTDCTLNHLADQKAFLIRETGERLIVVHRPALAQLRKRGGEPDKRGFDGGHLLTAPGPEADAQHTARAQLG